MKVSNQIIMETKDTLIASIPVHNAEGICDTIDVICRWKRHELTGGGYTQWHKVSKAYVLRSFDTYVRQDEGKFTLILYSGMNTISMSWYRDT